MFIDHDPVNHRHVAMWQECGMQFRSNVIEAGGQIELHSHSYDHIALCTSGWFECTTVSPGGKKSSFQVAAKDFASTDPSFNPTGYKVLIPAGYQHTFVLKEARNVGEILCMWPIGHDGVNE